MAEPDTKQVLWENVSRLMGHHWGKENLTRLAREADIGPGTAVRLREGATSIGTDVVDKIAGLFKLETWQLFVPGLDPVAPPGLGGDASSWPITMVSKERFTDLPQDARAFVEGYLARAIEEQEQRLKQRQAVPARRDKQMAHS